MQSKELPSAAGISDAVNACPRIHHEGLIEKRYRPSFIEPLRYPSKSIVT